VCHALVSGWVAGRGDVSVVADVLDVLAGQNRDRGISHSVMVDLCVRDRVVFYRDSNSREHVAYALLVVL